MLEPEVSLSEYVRGIARDDDLPGYLQQLIDLDHLEGASAGIARQVIARGVDSLSVKQRYIFEMEVVKPHFRAYCEHGSCSIPLCEMYEAIHGDANGMCNYCAHMHEKAMRED